MWWKGKGVGVAGESKYGVTLGKGGRWNCRKRREGCKDSNTCRWIQEILEGLGVRQK